MLVRLQIKVVYRLLPLLRIDDAINAPGKMAGQGRLNQIIQLVRRTVSHRREDQDTVCTTCPVCRIDVVGDRAQKRDRFARRTFAHRHVAGLGARNQKYERTTKSDAPRPPAFGQIVERC